MHDASTSIKPIKAVGILPPLGPRKEVFRAVMQRAEEAFKRPLGLTCITADRAFFQLFGDSTFYSVAITSEESTALGFISL